MNTVNIIKGFIKSISQKLLNNDLKVIVGGDIYTCNSVKLAKCSFFFAALLKSNMKEKREMKVELFNISSPIFKLILDSLDTGCDFLTKENVVEVWSAVNQLQIQFLIKHCEDFVESNLSLDSVELYKDYAEYFISERVCEFIYNFILKNFGSLRDKDIFLRLEFKYLIQLLQSDKLQVTSEDLVLYSVFDWVNYGTNLTKISDAVNPAIENESSQISLNNMHGVGSSQNREKPKKASSSFDDNVNSIVQIEQNDPVLNQKQLNKRKQFLIPLLKATRYCLASKKCIASLNTNKLIQMDNLVKELLFESLNFKLGDYLYGHWPTAAIHRDCSDVEHVGVFCDDGDISAFSFKQEKWFCIEKLPNQLNAKLTVSKGKLYACSIGSAPNEIYVFQTNMWVKVAELSHAVQLLLTHEKYIYMFDVLAKQITRFNPDISAIEFEMFVHEIVHPVYALSFRNNIVLFSSVDNNGAEETAVHSWNTTTQVWTKLHNLNFSSKTMTSFRNDRDTYILDCNGNLFTLTYSEIVGLAFVAKLWSGHYNIFGTLMFRDTLFIFDDSPHDVEVLDKVEGVFTSKKIWQIAGKISNCIHYVASRDGLIPDKFAASE